MGNSEAASHNASTECQLHAEQQAQLDNLTTDVRLLAADQRAASDWRTQQAEMNRRLMTETQAARRASEKSAEAAVKAVDLVTKMDAKWDRKHEEIVGRVATLEDKVEEIIGGPPPALGGSAPASPPSPRHSSIPSILPDLIDADGMSDTTKTDLLASDKDGALAFAIKERKTVVELTAKVAALEATVAERDRQSQRVRQDRKDDNMLRLHWGKLVIGAIVTLIAGLVGGGIVSKEMFHKPAAQVSTQQEK